jgi:hypothetical protein
MGLDFNGNTVANCSIEKAELKTSASGAIVAFSIILKEGRLIPTPV